MLLKINNATRTFLVWIVAHFSI